MTPAVAAEGLVKRFGATRALDGLDLVAAPGTVTGVLGPNGAGKTTVVRILATLLRADAGHATVAGHDVRRFPDRVRAHIGLTGQYASVDADLSATANLVLVGRLLGLSRAAARARAAELVTGFELAEVANRPARTYSGGTRRRLDLAASLVGRPAVLFLDEPTTGLDPHARATVWAVVRRLADEGTTVLLTTQYLEEADRLADRVTVVDRGRVVAEGRTAELKRRFGGHTVQVRAVRRAHVAAVARILAGLTGTPPAVDTDLGLVTAPLTDPAELSTVVQLLADAGIAADELALRLPTLDEVFLALTRGPATAASTR